MLASDFEQNIYTLLPSRCWKLICINFKTDLLSSSLSKLSHLFGVYFTWTRRRLSKVFLCFWHYLRLHQLSVYEKVNYTPQALNNLAEMTVKKCRHIPDWRRRKNVKKRSMRVLMARWPSCSITAETNPRCPYTSSQSIRNYNTYM